jgi:hypothetical protein
MVMIRMFKNWPGRNQIKRIGRIYQDKGSKVRVVRWTVPVKSTVFFCHDEAFK